MEKERMKERLSDAIRYCYIWKGRLYALAGAMVFTGLSKAAAWTAWGMEQMPSWLPEQMAQVRLASQILQVAAMFDCIFVLVVATCDMIELIRARRITYWVEYAPQRALKWMVVAIVVVGGFALLDKLAWPI